MTTADAVAGFVAVNLVAVGVSHVVQARAWGEFFARLRRWPAAGLAVGAATLPLGLLVVLGHNVWAASPAVLVTLVGWGWAIKGTVYLLHPAAFHRLCPETAEAFAPASRRVGLVMTALGAVLAAHTFAGGA